LEQCLRRKEEGTVRNGEILSLVAQWLGTMVSAALRDRRADVLNKQSKG